MSAPRIRPSYLFVLAAIFSILTSQAALAQRKTSVKHTEMEIAAPEAHAPAVESPEPVERVIPAVKPSSGDTKTQGNNVSTSPARQRGKQGSLDWYTRPTIIVEDPKPLAPATAGQLIISEFRWNGSNGSSDEFIEIYNNTNSDLTVNTSDGSSGYAFAKSTGTILFTIPNNTVIPARGHYLGCNSTGYSLGSYPAGNGTTATCDATYSGVDAWPLNTGGALFNTANPANFILENRLDAVGATAEANPLYKEGVGVRNLSNFSIAYSYFRRLPGGCIGTNPGTADSNCTNTNAVASTGSPTSSYPQDTGENRTDFLFTDTNGQQISSEASQQRLGAPGPENMSSPILRGHLIPASLIDPCVASSSSPNRVRDLTNDPGEPNDTNGSLIIRRKFTNNTGANVTRLRFRIVDITTFPSGIFSLPPAPNNFCGALGSECAADLRALTSTAVVVSVSAACGGGTATVQGTTLEQAASPEHQSNGGGFNSTLSAGTITLATPLGPGLSQNFQFRLGVQQIGKFRFFVNIEALP